jgi:hypothetical protein
MRFLGRHESQRHEIRPQAASFMSGMTSRTAHLAHVAVEKFLVGRIVKGRVRRPAIIVDENARRAERAADIPHHAVNGRLVRYIARPRRYAVSGDADFGNDLLELLHGASKRHDVAPLFSQLSRDGFAQPAAGTEHDRDLTRYTKIHRCIFAAMTIDRITRRCGPLKIDARHSLRHPSP